MRLDGRNGTERRGGIDAHPQPFYPSGIDDEIRRYSMENKNKIERHTLATLASFIRLPNTSIHCSRRRCYENHFYPYRIRARAPAHTHIPTVKTQWENERTELRKPI